MSPGSNNLISSSMASLSSFERRLLVGFPVWHLAAHFLARHLWRDISDGLLVETLGLPFGLPFGLSLLLAPRRPDPLAVGSVLGLQKGAEEIYGYGQHDG